MSQLIQISNECLSQVVASLSKTPWEEEIGAKVREMQAELQKTCLIAVCGEARAGKSTFINAFLGVDLAKTGATETTSTLTYFRYGSKKNDGKVVCHWKNGKKSAEKMAFVNSLQGHDAAAMKKVAEISHIDIYINTPNLINITLVDTPGSGSLVETHEHNARALIQSQQEETRQLTRQADAVVYLLGHVGKVSDSEFIKEFRGLSGRTSNPMNAVGVMAKIDRSTNILKNRWRFAKEVLNEFPELNTVIPVSALLEKTLKTLEPGDKLRGLQKWLRRIPKESCEELLDEREFFDEDDTFDDCPYSPIERRKKRSGIQWTVFQLIARTLVAYDYDKALALLSEYAGFEELRKVIKMHFFERAQLLKCSHIISRIHHELMQIQLYKLHEKQKELITRKAKIRKFNALMSSLGGRHQMPKELVELIRKSKTNDFNPQETRKKIYDALKTVEAVLEELTSCNDDFSALQLLNDHSTEFTSAEFKELTNLFGQYGLNPSERLNHLSSSDAKTIIERQLYWQSKEKVVRRTKLIVAEQAQARYTRILTSMPTTQKQNSQAVPSLASMTLW